MLSAYRIGAKVWIVNTAKVADPKLPSTLPIGSAVFTLEEARELARQIQDAASSAGRKKAKARL